MSTLEHRILDAAKAYYEAGDDIEFNEEYLCVERDNDRGGYWVDARLFVHDIDIIPNPGPSYTVWFCYDANKRRKTPIYSDWESDETYVFDDDPDGKRARKAAFDRARYLRHGQEPWMFCAVRPIGKEPLPLKLRGT